MHARFMRPALALALASLAASAAAADNRDLAAELARLSAQLAQLKSQYEARIEALEQRLAGPPPTPAIAAASGASADRGAGGFNPEISLVLAGTATRQSRDPATWRIGGFVPAGEPDEIGPPRRRGLTLQESELGIAANIDADFRGVANIALTPDNGVEVEEAFIRTLSLPAGLTLKAGRFRSGVGYQNEQHAHVRDFADAPLAYAAFVGNALTAEGLQLRWLAPTDTFVELGVEAGRDDGFPGSARNKRGSGLGAVFAHVGGDVGSEQSWRAGLSLFGTRPQDRGYEDSDMLGMPTRTAFSGRSRTLLADVVWKWAPQGNARERNLKLQGEYFRRRETGTLSCSADAGSGSNCAGGFADSYASRQSGYYAQAVYQFVRGWRVGYRYDRLAAGETRIGLVDAGVVGANAQAFSAADFPALAAHRPTRQTLMADWSPSEFSRLRLQFAHDRARPGEADRQLWLQYIMSLGAHGAHAY